MSVRLYICCKKLVIIIGIAKNNRARITSVSYTHLDVYKRQVVYCGVRIEHFANPFSAWFGGPYIVMNYWVSCVVTMFWIVGICNAVNLLDGLDGLAVGVSSISSIALLALTLISDNLNVAILTAAVAGAGFGFLPYNFNPAKIFMGDTGALFLGFILACISVQGLSLIHILIDSLSNLANNLDDDGEFIDGYVSRLYERLRSPMPGGKFKALHINSMKLIKSRAVLSRLIISCARDEIDVYKRQDICNRISQRGLKNRSYFFTGHKA